MADRLAVGAGHGGVRAHPVYCGAVMGDVTVSEDKQRAYVENIFGVALYKAGYSNGDHTVYSHQGIVESTIEADKWLNGEPVAIIQVYPLEYSND